MLFRSDDSVDNTMSFVQSNIVPQLKAGFEDMLNKVAERTRSRIVGNAEKAPAGYERDITEIDCLLGDLQRFIIK